MKRRRTHVRSVPENQFWGFYVVSRSLTGALTYLCFRFHPGAPTKDLKWPSEDWMVDCCRLPQLTGRQLEFSPTVCSYEFLAHVWREVSIVNF
jgi:hypothetical protein